MSPSSPFMSALCLYPSCWPHILRRRAMQLCLTPYLFSHSTSVPLVPAPALKRSHPLKCVKDWMSLFSFLAHTHTCCCSKRDKNVFLYSLHLNVRQSSVRVMLCRHARRRQTQLYWNISDGSHKAEWLFHNESHATSNWHLCSSEFWSCVTLNSVVLDCLCDFATLFSGLWISSF